MTLNVRQRAETIATFRFIEVALMETLSRWIPTTPEMEVKVLFGRHVWEVAQHADALGKRTYELRAPMHFTQRPTESYSNFLQRLAELERTAERLTGFYDVTLPALTRRYERFLAATDQLLDAPSVKVVRRILHDMVVMQQEAGELRRQFPTLEKPASALAALAAAEDRVGEIVVHHERARAETGARA